MRPENGGRWAKKYERDVMKIWKEIAKKILHSGLPVPEIMRLVIRLLYYCGVFIDEAMRILYKWFIVEPVMRSIASVGSGFRIERIPYIRGKGKIIIGSDVYISGKIGISFSSHILEKPEFYIGNHTFIGHQCGFSMAKKIVIGNNCFIAASVNIQDNDGHPLDPDLRRAHKPVSPDNVHPVIIKDGVWIAAGARVLKGVTIGENSVVGAGSIVTKDVPPNTVVAGNPAKVIRTIGGGERGRDVRTIRSGQGRVGA